MPLFFVEVAILFTLPVLVAGFSAWIKWPHLARPWIYLGATTLCLYAIYIACMYFLSPKSVGYIVSGVPSGKPIEPMPLFMLLEPYKIPLLVFLGASMPVVFALLRAFKQASQ